MISLIVWQNVLKSMQELISDKNANRWNSELETLQWRLGLKCSESSKLVIMAEEVTPGHEYNALSSFKRQNFFSNVS